MATIADVARAAGVSRSTVSYALSGKRAVSPDTLSRVRRAVRDLGYTPHAGAQALALARTGVIGLMLPVDHADAAPAVTRYVAPISAAARRLGYDLLLVTDIDGPSALRRVTESGRVDGLVLLDVTQDDPRLPALRAAERPAVLIGLPRDVEGLDVVDLDFRVAAEMVVDHLAALGHRRVTLVTPAREVFARGAGHAWRFRSSCLARARTRGLRLYPHFAAARQADTGHVLDAVLRTHPDATALVLHDDRSVAALPAVLHERAMRVPGDLSVVGLHRGGGDGPPPYTAVDASPLELGGLAVRRLVSRMTAAPDAEPVGVTLLRPHLTDRASTA
ncbi:LacI family DNA-binding transcriptional regulator [Actinoalloteichus spitiensis]|uniref:LacI family DNA-binding transcriptional regulator n=1 Tax=Actinoalloteichus spitiensis TaxID=252394 RepID=UPI00047533E4|nr:LacI family DNA-binding transcriptional regulator [Actinoalloteichus spitiensis]